MQSIKIINHRLYYLTTYKFPVPGHNYIVKTWFPTDHKDMDAHVIELPKSLKGKIKLPEFGGIMNYLLEIRWYLEKLHGLNEAIKFDKIYDGFDAANNIHFAYELPLSKLYSYCTDPCHVHEDDMKVIKRYYKQEFPGDERQAIQEWIKGLAKIFDAEL